MTDDDARRFATRMIDTWPGGPKHYVWADIARPLDPALARIALHELEHTNPRPTPQAFHDAYRAAAAAQDRTPPSTCERCDGTGWIDAPPSTERRTTAVVPCRCTRGRHMEDVARRITDHNARS